MKILKKDIILDFLVGSQMIILTLKYCHLCSKNHVKIISGDRQLCQGLKELQLRDKSPKNWTF